MLPPVDPRVLERNPNFDVLYQDLTTRKLNPDGSTRDTKKQRIHDEIRRSLVNTRIELISSKTLIRSLSDLPSKAIDLPPELHSVIEIVVAQLNGHVPEPDREILSGDVDYFLENITAISDALSSQLSIVAECLCKIANPKKPPSVTDLPTMATSVHQTATLDLPHELSLSYMALSNATSSLLATHVHFLSTSIKVLEQTQHGALARHTKASAELLHTRSTLLGLQAKIHTFSHPPPPEFVAALKEFKKSQGTGEKALRDRGALARQEIELYEKAGEKGMRDLAKRKEHLVNETEKTEREIRKLKRGD